MLSRQSGGHILSQSESIKIYFQLFAYWVICMLFGRLLIFFSKLTFSKNSFSITIRVANSLDPDKALHLVGPDLDPNYLQRLADNSHHQS